MNKRLRPMGVGAVLDNTFSILRERFWTFQGVNFFAYLPAFIISVIGVVVGVIGYLPFLRKGGPGFNDRFWTEAFGGFGIILLVIWVITLIVSFVICSIYFAYGNIKVFKCGLHLEKCTVWEAFKGIKGKRWRYFATQLLVVVIYLPFIIIGLILMRFNEIVGTIMYYIFNLLSNFVFLLLVLTPTVVFFENKGVFKSLSRAFTMMSRHRWRVIGTIFLVYLLCYVLIMIPLLFIGLPIFLAFNFPNLITFLLALVFGLGGLFVLSILISFFFGPITALYYDLLIRKEGYDIQLQLAEQNDALSNSDDRSIPI